MTVGIGSAHRDHIVPFVAEDGRYHLFTSSEGKLYPGGDDFSERTIVATAMQEPAAVVVVSAKPRSQMMGSRVLSLAACFVLSLAGCGSGGSTGADMSMSAARCSAPVPVTCSDNQIQDLSFKKAPSPDTRLIVNTADGTGFVSEIDASAGGLDPTESYVYATFGPTGLSKVAIGDEASLTSQSWDIAIRRFVIRLNSGVSGPSCVDGARTATGTTWEGLTAEPAGLEYRTEAYYTASCDLVPDGSGLGSPGTALQSFWRYPGCVQMTDNIFVLRLADGRRVKLMVNHYYEQETQDYCDANDMVRASDAGKSGHVGVRWAFL